MDNRPNGARGRPAAATGCGGCSPATNGGPYRSGPARMRRCQRRSIHGAATSRLALTCSTSTRASDREGLSRARQWPRGGRSSWSPTAARWRPAGRASASSTRFCEAFLEAGLADVGPRPRGRRLRSGDCGARRLLPVLDTGLLGAEGAPGPSPPARGSPHASHRDRRGQGRRAPGTPADHAPGITCGRWRPGPSG